MLDRLIHRVAKKLPNKRLLCYYSLCLCYKYCVNVLLWLGVVRKILVIAFSHSQADKTIINTVNVPYRLYNFCAINLETKRHRWNGVCGVVEHWKNIILKLSCFSVKHRWEKFKFSGLRFDLNSVFDLGRRITDLANNNH